MTQRWRLSAPVRQLTMAKYSHEGSIYVIMCISLSPPQRSMSSLTL